MATACRVSLVSAELRFEKTRCGHRQTGPCASAPKATKTRRAAKMQSLKVWHPDILEFIECKWKEEQKAHTLIESGKYEANFNGDAYSSILFQNANLSVRVTDEFMETVEKGGKWTTRWVSDLASGDYLLGCQY